MVRSIVAVFCGGRRSGKTLSATGEGVLELIKGRNVWSNYPIHAHYIDSGGSHFVKSVMIDLPDLLAIQKQDVIRDGLIILDEWNLFCNSRRSGSMSNVIFSGVVQLIGKRKLSLYITTQDFQTLDKNIRWQCDLTVECFDLSFRYGNLQNGALISQNITDWSGVLTGRALSKYDDYDARMRNSRRRILNGKLFHYCYPTGFEYDVLDLMSTRYNLQKQNMIINPGAENDGFRGKLIDEMREAFILSGNTLVSVEDMKKSLEDMGIEADLRGSTGKYLAANGFKYKQTRSGNFYEVLK